MYYLEAQRDSVRDFLQCRTIGVPIAHSRLLGFHVVRSTRPVTLLITKFVLEKQYSRPREDTHKAKHTNYPHSWGPPVQCQPYAPRTKLDVFHRLSLGIPLTTSLKANNIFSGTRVSNIYVLSRWCVFFLRRAV